MTTIGDGKKCVTIIKLYCRSNTQKKLDLADRRLLMSQALFNLALKIKERFSQSNDDRDLEIAIALHGRALALTPLAHANVPLFLGKLAEAIEARYDASGRAADLTLVIKLYRTLVDVSTDSDHPDKADHTSIN